MQSPSVAPVRPLCGPLWPLCGPSCPSSAGAAYHICKYLFMNHGKFLREVSLHF